MEHLQGAKTPLVQALPGVHKSLNANPKYGGFSNERGRLFMLTASCQVGR